MGEFSEKVFRVVAQIPSGKVATYGQVARLIGSARSARYVGYALRNNPSPAALEFARRFHGLESSQADASLANGHGFEMGITSNPATPEAAAWCAASGPGARDSGSCTDGRSGSRLGVHCGSCADGPTDQELAEIDNESRLIPCHRVVFADGSLCRGFAFGGPEVQRAMLQEEGVTFVDDDRIDLADCQWDGTMFALDGDGVPEGAPTTPPADFDWAAELGED